MTLELVEGSTWRKVSQWPAQPLTFTEQSIALSSCCTSVLFFSVSRPFGSWLANIRYPYLFLFFYFAFHACPVLTRARLYWRTNVQREKVQRYVQLNHTDFS